jgi:hypothetical protein
MKRTLLPFLPALGSKLIPFKNLSCLLLVLLFSGGANAQVTLTATAGTSSGSFTTLKGAFDAINAGTHTGTIAITITANTTESAIASLNASGAGSASYSSVSIQPSGGAARTISGSLATELVLLNGADNVTIDGLNTGGNSLTISNTSTASTSGTSTLKLQADATNNTFNNVTFLTAATMAAGTNGGAVFISTGTTTGNDNNSFQSCKFSSSTSNSGVLFYANGSTTSTAEENSNVTVNNCEFYNYFLASGTQAAMYISTGNTAFSITNNKIYQTATRTITSSSTVYGIYCVNANTTALGENFTITGNTIGYNNNAGTGTMTYAAGTTGGGFTGILFNHSATSTGTSNINTNIVSNIQWTSTGSSVFTGISSTSLASTTVGNTLNMNSNQVKNITQVNSTGQITGILSGYSPAVTISNNTIDNITRSGAGTFYAINYSGATSSSFTFNLNTISNLSITSTTSTSAFYGIYSGTSPATEIWTNNTIDGLTSSSTAANTVIGIYNFTATTGNKTCQNNIVRNISLPASGTGTAYGIRISYLGATNLISGNTVNTITGGTNIYGMLVGSNSAATTTSVYKNKIYGLSNSINAATNVYGLVLGTQGTSSNCHVYNNIIGDLTSSAANSTTDAVRGISITSASLTSNINLFYNTVYITGAASSSTNFATSALFHTHNGTSTTASLTLKNNIFVNNYPSKGAGVSAAFKRSAATDLLNYATASNYNLFYGTNIYYDGTNTDVSLSAFKARVTTRETASFSENPTWVSTTGSSSNFLHINTTTPTQIESGGTPISSPISITDDYDAVTRDVTTPDVGADEGTFTIAVPMSYTSSTTEQLTGFAYAGATNQSIIRVQIVTTGATTPLSLTSLTLNANGTTDIADINAATAKVYYTGASTTFVTSSLFGSTTPTVANFTVTGSQTLVEGNNYFWLAYDVASAATSANLIDGECIDLTVGTVQTPTVSAPSGNKSILGAMSGTYAVGASQTENGSAFTTLTTAIADLNLRGVSGAVIFALQSDYSSATETFPLTINAITGASGTNTITIKPAATVTATISGSSSSSIFKLNGADYVIIDGSNNGSTSRNLTISNSSTSTSSGILWIASATASNGATNNTVKNCIITGNASTTTLMGVFMGGTSSISTTTSALIDNATNTIQNNQISLIQYGVFVRDVSAISLGTGLTIAQNNIGTSVNAIGITGIVVHYQDAAMISQNEIQNQSTTSTSNSGGIILLDNKNSTITRNKIYNLNYSGSSTGKIVGIHTSTATYNTSGSESSLNITNNIIYNLNSTATSSSWNTSGISNNGGYGDKYYFNTVHLTGTLSGSTGGSACFANGNGLTSTNADAIDVSNNIFSMQGSSTAAAPLYAHYTTRTSYSGSTLNYNSLYATAGGSATAHVGRFNATNYTTFANWQGAFSQEANSIGSNPNLNSSTNLIPQLGSPVIGAGIAIGGITIDYLGTTRNNPPTIGAYETAVDEAAPVITYTALSSTCLTTNITLTATITDASGVPTAGVLMPRIYYKKDAGAWFSSQGVLSSGTATNGTWTFTIVAADMGGVANPNVISYYVIAQDIVSPINITSNPSAGLVATDVNTVSTAPTTPNTYTIQNTLAAGTYTVGAGQTYATLTAAVAAYNTSCLGGAIVFSLMDVSYAGETFPITINANADASATNTLTIKPASGVTAAISGSSAVAIFKLNGADYVIIDGSNSGSTSKDLTITNTNTGTSSAVVWLGSASASNGATNNTIKNCIVTGNAPTTTLAGLISSSGTTIGAAAQIANANNTYNNNTVNTAYYGIAVIGPTGNESGTVISGNLIGSATAGNKIGGIGILVNNQSGVSVTGNTIFGVTTSTDYTVSGIYVYGTQSGGTISGNNISDIKNTSSNLYDANGIFLGSSSTTASIDIYNNIIFDITGVGESTSSYLYYNGHGIVLYSGGGYNIYSNTVNMNTNQTDGLSSAIYITSSLVTAASVNIRNNIFANTQTAGVNAGKRFAIYCAAANTIFGTINHNDYYTSGTHLGYRGSNRTTLAEVVTGFGGNANSISALPSFTSVTDLHLTAVASASGNAALKAGTPISGITTDYDGEIRNTVTPAMGADEIFIDGFWSGATSTVWDASVTGNWDNGTIPASGVDIVVPAGVTNSPVLTSVSPTIGMLNLGTGKTLTLGSNTLTVNGEITGTGTLTGSATSSLVIGGTAGTLNFTNGSRTLKDLTLNSSTSATLGTALNITAGINSGTLIVGTGATLSSAGNLTLKSDANGTAKVGNSPGTVSGNVTVERYIPAKRAWRALTTPLKGSDTSIFSQWQNNGSTTDNTIGVELWGPGGTGSSGNGLAVGPSNSILQYDNSTTGSWTPVTNTNNTLLFSTARNNAFMVFPTGGYGSGLISSSTTAVPTTLKATGQLITGEVTYSIPSSSHTLIGNPYACAISPLALLTANTTFDNNLWIWDPNVAGDLNVGAYNLFTKTGVSTGTYTNTTGSSYTSNPTPDIQSGQAFFVKAATGTQTLTFTESLKTGTVSSNAIFREGTPAEILRLGLYKQENNEWSGRDGAITVLFSDANANQTPNKMANGSENIAFVKNGSLFASNHHLPLVASDVLNIRVWRTTAGANYKLKINTEDFVTTNLSATLEDLFTNSRTPLNLEGVAVEYPFTVTTDALSTGDRFRIVFQNAVLGTNTPTATSFSIVPNPVIGDTFQVNLGTLATGNYSYSICNAIGQEVEKGSFQNATQNTNYTIKFRESAATGIYIMKIKGSDNTVITAKLIKK